MPSYTVSKNGYDSVSGSFTWADSNITVTLNSQKPEHLYAWTDADIVPLYAWTDEYEDYVYFYTLSETPSTGDILYGKDNSGNIYQENPEYVSISEIVSETQIKVWTLGDSYYCNRDISKDTILDKSITLYTASTTITTGMTLYDNTGTDTGKTIGTINQDGSFDIQNTITITLIVQNMAGAMYGAGSGTVNSVSFTSDGSSITPNTIEVNAGESCTITALNGKNSNPNTSSYEAFIHLNGTQVTSHCGTATYTFTPTEDCTIGINFGIEPV